LVTNSAKITKSAKDQGLDAETKKLTLFFQHNKDTTVSNMTPTCACCGPLQLAGNHSRRGFLAAGAATVAGGLIGMAPFQAQAASGNYEAMLLSLIHI
jgi:hypothetical protein